MLAVLFSLIIGFMTNCHFLEFENNLFNSENIICGGIVEAVKAEDMHSYPTSTQRLLHSLIQLSVGLHQFKRQQKARLLTPSCKTVLRERSATAMKTAKQAGDDYQKRVTVLEDKMTETEHCNRRWNLRL